VEWRQNDTLLRGAPEMTEPVGEVAASRTHVGMIAFVGFFCKKNGDFFSRHSGRQKDRNRVLLYRFPAVAVK